MGEVALRGVIASGLGKAASFTELAWVREQLALKLGLQAWPGTLNVRLIDGASLAQWRALTERPGIEIEPPSHSACVARCYHVIVADTVPGAIILPHVADYPADQVEVLAAEHLRRALGLSDGDPIVLRVVEAPS